MQLPMKNRLLALFLLPMLAACGHVTNVELDKFDPDPHSSYRYDPKSDRDTLVIVNLSGGGIRAAALSYGVLQMLGQLPGRGQGTLLDEVDVISSVSGGSVTAGWYALNGRAGLEPANATNPLWQFLYHDWTSDLAWRLLNPWSLGNYAFTSRSRSDVLAEFFSEQLFGEATYAQVLDRYTRDKRQPYVILNATDLGHETGFTFTQGSFDLLCSDLSRYRLAGAVAASANYPLAFSATGLRNYSNCEAQRSPKWSADGPPQWISHYDEFDIAQSPAANAYQVTELRLARQANGYINPDARDRYIHLLDGGLIDNLGVRSALGISDDPARVPGLYLRLGPVRPDGYQNIRRVLYIVVNARTRDPANLDYREYPPDIVSTVMSMIYTQLDNSILDDESYLIAQLEAIANREVRKPGTDATQPPASPKLPFLSKKVSAQATHPIPPNVRNLEFDVVAVDFDMIPDAKCRDHFWSLGTNWGLKQQQITDLIGLGKVIMSRSPDLRAFYQSIGRREAVPQPLDFTSVCKGD